MTRTTTSTSRKTLVPFLRRAFSLMLALAALMLVARAILSFNVSPESVQPESVQMVLLHEFHNNVRAGQLAPVWAPRLGHGYGTPELEFLPPLPMYVAAGFLAVTGDSINAIRFATLLFALVAMGGVLLLVHELPDTSDGFATLASAGYILSPWALHAFLAARRLDEAAVLSIAPWTALAFSRLARGTIAKTSILGRLAVAAISFALLALSSIGVAAIAVAVALTTCIGLGRNARAFASLATALVLGAAASSYFWLPAIGERGLVRSALLTEPLQSAGLLPAATAIYCTGILGVAGILWALVRWAGNSPALAWRRGSNKSWRTTATLLAVSATALYFLHEFSEVWHSLLPPFYSPELALPYLLLAATMLGALAVARELSKPWHWALAAVIVLAGGLLPAHPTPQAQTKTRPPHYTGDARLKPAAPPVLPDNPAPAPVIFTRGRGEGSCHRPKPTVMDCRIMVVHTATIRFGLLDYPEWRVTVDNLNVASSRDPRDGALTLNLAPGNHLVRWTLHDTSLRSTGKWVSALAMFFMLGLFGIRDKAS